jgi:hypothetical protein
MVVGGNRFVWDRTVWWNTILEQHDINIFYPGSALNHDVKTRQPAVFRCFLRKSKERQYGYFVHGCLVAVRPDRRTARPSRRPPSRI